MTKTKYLVLHRSISNVYMHGNHGCSKAPKGCFENLEEAEERKRELILKGYDEANITIEGVTVIENLS